ncbi:MAG: GldG family protein [Spirochaetaceae bacterium]|nr:GldG family protein [Spirochaetaceae bacterium]
MKTSAAGRTLSRLLWCLIGILILLLSSLWYFRWDITEDKRFSLSSMSQQLLGSLTEPLRITYYLSSELEELNPYVRDVKDFLRLYALDSSHVQVEVKDPVKEGFETSLLQQGIFPQQIQSTKGNSTQLVTVYSAVVLEYLDQVAIIPFAQRAESLEYEMATRLLMLVEEVGSWPVILMSGNGLSIEEDYSDVVPWLEAAGFFPAVFSPQEFILLEEELAAGEGQKIPLMLFGSSQLTGNQVESIRRFVERGGKLLVMTSAHSAALYDDWTVTPTEDKLLPVLASWGIEVGQELVFDISCFQPTFLSEDENPVYEQVNYPLWIQALPQYTVEHPISRRAFDLEFYWASPLTLTSLESEPLVFTTPSAWLAAPEPGKDLPFVTNPFMIPQTPSQAGQLASQYVLSGMAFLEGGGQVLVVGSQYFLSTLMRQYTGSLGNLDFVTKALLQLSGQEFLLELKNKAAQTRSLHKVTQGELEASRPKVLAVNLVVLPLLPVLVALFFRLIKKTLGKEAGTQKESSRE